MQLGRLGLQHCRKSHACAVGNRLNISAFAAKAAGGILVWVSKGSCQLRGALVRPHWESWAQFRASQYKKGPDKLQRAQQRT